jgi:type II pantothenate kinase
MAGNRGLRVTVGIDIGASTTKAVMMSGSEILRYHFADTKDVTLSAAEAFQDILHDFGSGRTVEIIGASGGGSRVIGDTVQGIPVRRVDEIEAIGLGGLSLSKRDKGLIVSVGTGTAMVAAYRDGLTMKHVGGTGVGGGTAIGLSKRMLGINDFASLTSIASKGNLNNVDLSVMDIVGGSVGIIPAKATASNFGKLSQKSSSEDVAAGILSLISQVVGVVSSMAAKAYELEKDVILVGGFLKSRMASETIRKTTQLFGVESYVPRNCEYCTAVGAAISYRHIVEG